VFCQPAAIGNPSISKQKPQGAKDTRSSRSSWMLPIAPASRRPSGLPQIDILVNCAGAYSDGHVLDVSEDDLDALLKANLFSVLVTTQEVAGRMPPGGRVINIASRAFFGAPRQSLYACAKAAVVTLTRCMALDLSDRGILVNAVSPGLIETPMTDALPAERRAPIQRSIPGGRLGRPEEVASVVALLAGPGGSYINGANILVDAGRSLGGGMTS
jgi:3-oxoacyl-[acyl-carrier protein] reductase